MLWIQSLNWSLIGIYTKNIYISPVIALIKSSVECNQKGCLSIFTKRQLRRRMDGVDGLEIAFDPTDLTLANHKRGQERQKTRDRLRVCLNKSITLIE